jgi:multidrug efflux pump subunit AcrA (membrane-fusion protein)
MYAEIRIPDFNVTAKPFPVVTKNAVVYRGSLPYIFVMDEEEGAEIRIVRTGSEVGESKITILSGVKNGEKVVVNPPLNIKPGWKPEEGNK